MPIIFMFSDAKGLNFQCCKYWSQIIALSYHRNKKCSTQKFFATAPFHPYQLAVLGLLRDCEDLKLLGAMQWFIIDENQLAPPSAIKNKLKQASHQNFRPLQNFQWRYGEARSWKMNEAGSLTLAFAPGICRDRASRCSIPTFAATLVCKFWAPWVSPLALSLSLAAKHSNDDALVPSFAAANEPRSAAEIEI